VERVAGEVFGFLGPNGDRARAARPAGAPVRPLAAAAAGVVMLALNVRVINNYD
jgi:hypothetical protein